MFVSISQRKKAYPVPSPAWGIGFLLLWGSDCSCLPSDPALQGHALSLPQPTKLEPGLC